MLTFNYLDKYWSVFNKAKLAKESGINLDTLKAKFRNPPSSLSGDQIQALTKTLRSGGIKRRERVSGKEINEMAFVFNKVLAKKAGLSDKEVDKIYQGQSLSEEAEKKLGRYITQMATDITNTL
ncbi:hypothetical protein SAMN05443144_1336 [Fodinibius roseus]|uniref:Uncharacterized protein n=1 Tax=Fodinibius roseus TaxID=1194090 RepID=A0A1M5KMF4_9BACT|nr:hypothetical protein [Fodinibius roseus]SHG53925.1 hypothetical protein SAMN05443144_1336 [Fodinibius roseus]